MNAPTEPPPHPPAWQPLTFGGVAAFAWARWPRLALVQIIVAGLVAATVVFLLEWRWFPVVTEAVRGLADFGAVRDGRLAWPRTEATLLAENRFLGLVIDLEESGEAGQVADVQFEFARGRAKLVSLLGYVAVPYPAGGVVELNRAALDPWWNAWRPAFVWAGGLGTVAWLFTCWAALATLYAAPLRALAWLAGRAVSPGQCWRVASATLLPGALWVSGSLLCYGLEQLSLAGLGIAFALHLAVGWVYLLGAVFHLPRHRDESQPAGPNPFTPAPTGAKSAEPPPPAAAGGNPFQGPPGG